MKSNKGWIAVICCLVIAAVIGFVVMNGQSGTLREQLAAAENTVKEMETKLQDSEAQVKELTDKLTASAAEIETLTAEKEEMNAGMEAMKTRLEEVEATMQGVMSILTGGNAETHEAQTRYPRLQVVMAQAECT